MTLPEAWTLAAKLARCGFVQDLRELSGLDGLQAAVPPLELLESLEDRFGHLFVGFLGATHEFELLTFGDSFVPVVVIQTNPEKS